MVSYGKNSGSERLTVVLAFLGIGTLLLAGGAGKTFIDPDAWHQMSMVREALRLGWFPLTDPFGYTSTVTPLVHHEWGTGAAQLFLLNTMGLPGFALLRDLLALGIGLACVLCARRRGAGNAIVWGTFPVSAFLLWIGVTTVRAQMFTLFFLACLLWFLELDRAGRRAWIAPWLVMYLVWVNVHAGFFVGAVAFGLYGLEQLIHRRPVGRLIAVGLAMIALVAVNPYGLSYYEYLWSGLRMDRPLITEWQSILKSGALIGSVYVVSLLILVYALLRRGMKNAAGVLFLFAAAYAAARHQRHLSLYAVAWTCYVPALLQGTPLGAIFARVFAPGRRSVAVAAGLAAIIGSGAYLNHRPWSPSMPANPGDHPIFLYPRGAVDYMRDTQFRGNLITPFTAGAFISFELFPSVLVSMDGRYEVAYEPELLERHITFFDGKEGWEGLLDHPPADAALVRADAPVADSLAELTTWGLVYRDDAFELYARGSRGSPVVDRRGEHLRTTFP